ncbi:hypothetical protein [Seonamhaeicola sp. ML3]|uniref:DUF7486 family protein n=1 Tax=Seonamhaeicola sp. ML3 TaxID=2937786 RepID=UPI00200DB37E|nr:hypothetical protein [Seonamhaeicola sp. ML3]
MKNPIQLFTRNFYYKLVVLVFLSVAFSCKDSDTKANTSSSESDDIAAFKTVLWNVKAIQPNGKTLDVKVFDNAGNPIKVKAIQNSEQDNLLDVKAMDKDGELPIKILVSKSQFAPVVAINPKGSAYKVKAVIPGGDQLDVIGVARYGNVVIMKAVTKKGKFYPVKAISPDGKLNDIKGVKINFQDREMGLKGHNIYAHVKAMHAAVNEDSFVMPKANNPRGEYTTDFKRIIWNIKAVDPDGENLDIKAFDADGEAFDVKAIQDSEQHSFMNIKALASGVELSVKIIDSDEGYAPVKAFGTDGTIYDIKAITADNKKLDIMGVSRYGNIVDVKAVTENGEFYPVKAFSPDGKLNAVKGIKIFERKIEMRSQGNPVYAHLKAIAQ